jgi:FAD/FMN-containing dehydrogenase
LVLVYNFPAIQTLGETWQGERRYGNPATASDLLREFAREAVALGGTVSAEHGLGKRKRHLLELQYGAAEIEAMRAVKRRLDPGDILGRGTLLGDR